MRESGRFMTLLYTVIDGPNKSIRWVRAGHDPAIFYAPVPDSFEELKGSGIALGVDESWQYQENEKKNRPNNEIKSFIEIVSWESDFAKLCGMIRAFDSYSRNRQESKADWGTENHHEKKLD